MFKLFRENVWITFYDDLNLNFSFVKLPLTPAGFNSIKCNKIVITIPT